MELMTEEKKGFKRTDVGLIPEDWKVYTFDELFDFLKTGSLSRRHLNNEGDTYYIHYGDIHAKWKRILDFDNAVVPKVDAEKVRGLPTLEEGDLIIADASEDYEGVGASVEVKNLNGKRAVSGLHTILLRGKKDLIVDGLKAYLTHTESVRDRLKQVSTGTTVYGISKSKLKDVEIPLPPTLEEQQAIAEALSDVGELIRSLDGLIQKKQAIKKGTMQQLLTPPSAGQASKKRLPGFDGEWEVVKLGELAEVKGGKRLPKGWSLKDEISNHPYIRVADMVAGGVDLSNLMYVPEEIAPEISNYRIYEDDLFISVAGTLGIVGEVPKKLSGANLTENADRLTNIQCNKKYLLYYLLSPAIQDAIKESRTLGAQPKLAIERIKQFDVFLSNSIKEQKAIAQILSDMDRELQTLRQKREKYVQIKQGMMQELLMGRTRLV